MRRRSRTGPASASTPGFENSVLHRSRQTAYNNYASCYLYILQRGSKMVTWALIVFAIAAVAGLTMAIGVFKGRTTPPVSTAVIHGIFAASGLVLLLLAVFKEGAGNTARWALYLFLLAAIGGFTLALGYHARKRPLPTGLVAGHALLAVAAFLILLIGFLGVM